MFDKMSKCRVTTILALLTFNLLQVFSAPCDGPTMPIFAPNTTTTTTKKPGEHENFIVPPTHHKVLFAPYYDTTLDQGPSLLDIYEKTGQKDFTLAFALGRSCSEPSWGGSIDLNEPRIIDQIRQLQSKGGQFIVATGGAVGPYLEHICSTPETLTAAYKKVLSIVGTHHIDIDVEAPISNDVVTKALAALQRDNPAVTVSFTLPVQGDDYGVTNALGTDVLKSARDNGVRVDIVNPMTMEYPTRIPDWGESVIQAATAVHGQMKEIWPEKSEEELYKMLSVTPMIGRNFNGKIFKPTHGKKLVKWANSKHIGLLAFWSAARDNGMCAGGGISPLCSSIDQHEYEFIKIFQKFRG